MAAGAVGEQPLLLLDAVFHVAGRTVAMAIEPLRTAVQVGHHVGF